MPRPAWLRLLIAVWGCWFTITVVEPAALFACEMHGAPAGRGAAAHVEPAASQATAHGGHAIALDVDASAHRHDMASARPAGAAHPADATPEPAPHHCCTCLGHCCQASPVAAPATAVTLAWMVESHAHTAAITVVSYAATRRPYEQPFANGPPAGTL